MMMSERASNFLREKKNASKLAEELNEKQRVYGAKKNANDLVAEEFEREIIFGEKKKKNESEFAEELDDDERKSE